MNRLKHTAMSLLLVSMSAPVFAGNVTIPNTFSSGTPAVAAEVNANFNAVASEINDNDGRITTNSTEIANLKATITSLQNTITTLQNQLAAVQGNSVLALDGNLVYTVDAYGYPTAQFTGINVQVVNGTGTTDGAPNGLGNLIVGYNAVRSAGNLVCSDGQYTDQTACESAGETWAQSHKSGSHNIVAGDRNSYSQYGGVVFGIFNVINRPYATVSGGTYNTASGRYSSVSGGYLNIASGGQSSVSGGQANTASYYSSSVSGGFGNTASGSRSSVSGGYLNTASGDYSSVSGGYLRSATGIYDWAAGSQYEDY